MFFIFLLATCVAIADGKGVNSCTKYGIAGVCTNINECPDAQHDLQNQSVRPQICEFVGEDVIVCCLSSVSITSRRPEKSDCILPPYPEHGTYVTNIPNGKLGEGYDFLFINVTCHEGYGVKGTQAVFCQGGKWSKKMPTCVFNSCTKDGIAGVCTNINECPDAQQDLRNKIQPQICEFVGEDVIVCCLSSVSITSRSPEKSDCILPPYPEHGTYVTNIPDGKLGEGYDFLFINVTCHEGYGVQGTQAVFCRGGKWSKKMPTCVSVCHLPSHPSVEYHCIPSGLVMRSCEELEPHGTVVSPQCRAPYYYAPRVLSYMRCINGSWDYIAKCNHVCGFTTPEGEKLLPSGKSDRRVEVPWHAGIYTKTEEPYTLVCGGSLVSTTMIISAAHCFWSYKDGKQPEYNYAAAVGKLYWPWDDPNEDENAQKSDVKKIHLPPRFQGIETSFQDDFAIVIVTTPFVLKIHVRPVCLDFDYFFETWQLNPGNQGKIAGWGLTSKSSDTSLELKTVNVQYVSFATCMAEWPKSYLEYITSDKICAAQNVTDGLIALSKGDSGGGFVISTPDQGKQRHYLRGVTVLAVAPCGADNSPCNIKTYIGFTQVSRHESFIKRFWEN